MNIYHSDFQSYVTERLNYLLTLLVLLSCFTYKLRLSHNLSLGGGKRWLSDAFIT